MQNFINAFPKFLFLFLCLIICLISCQKDDPVPAEEVQLELSEQKVRSQKMAFKDVIHFDRLNKQISGLSEKLNETSENQRLEDGDEVFEILTDEVLYMEYDDTYTYTFKLVRENPEYYIENILLYYNTETENYNEYLVQYEINAEQFLQIINEEILIENLNAKMTSLESGFVASNIASRGSCYIVCEWIPQPCGGNLEHPPGVNCPHIGTDLEAYYYQSCSSICFDFGDEDETIEAPDDPIGNGGGVANTNPMPGTPCNTSSGLTGVVNASGGCSIIDDGIADDCLIAEDLGIDCTALTLFEQDYRPRMSAPEIVIFDSMPRDKQLAYLANGQFATWKSEEHFLLPNSLYNGKGDAFRHAYWNAANVNDLGAILTEELTSAHEERPPSYTYSYLEKQMDLLNNQEGRLRWNWPLDGYSSLEESILAAINDGSLFYLTNLTNGSYGQATSQSQLISTNL